MGFIVASHEDYDTPAFLHQFWLPCCPLESVYAVCVYVSVRWQQGSKYAQYIKHLKLMNIKKIYVGTSKFN